MTNDMRIKQLEAQNAELRRERDDLHRALGVLIVQEGGTVIMPPDEMVGEYKITRTFERGARDLGHTITAVRV